MSLPPRSRLNSRLLVAGMLLLAVGAAMLGILYLRGLSERSLAYWGPQTAELILQAPHVEIWQLGSSEGEQASSGVEKLTLADQTFAVLDRRDVSQAPGLMNLRRGLMQDSSYDWQAGGEAPSEWDYALLFHDGEREALLLFSGEWAAGRGLQPVSTSPMGEGLTAFFQEQF